MKRGAKREWKFLCFLLNLRRYSLTFLFSVILLSDMVDATPPGRELQIGQQSVTTQQDAKRAAEQAFQEGFELYKQGTAESLRKAILKWEKALKLWQQVNDKAKQALALNIIGLVYSDLGDKQKALEYYNQALPLKRAVGDKSGEATTLNNIGKVYYDLGEKQKALEYFNQALPLRRAVGDKSGEATTLNNIGRVYSDLGDKQKALEYYNQALPLKRAVGDKSGEATTLNNIGKVYYDLGEKQKALEYFNQALPLRRAVGDKSGEATTLNNIGKVYYDLGEKQKALEYFNQALPLRRAVGDKSGEATTVNNLGIVYSDLGENQKALEYFNQALPLRRAVGDKSGEATTLNNIGRVYSDLGEKQKALDYYNQALPLRRAVGDKSGEATTLNNIGRVYSDLGEKQKALDYYNQALPLRRAVGDKSGEATTLNNIGLVYSDLGEKQKALEYFNQALPLRRAVGDKSGEATTLNNIGSVYDALGEKQKALEYYNQALPLRRAVGDKFGEAATLNNIGLVYSDLGEKQKALEYFNQALPLRRAVGDKSGEATTLNNIGKVYDALGEKQKALDYFNQALPLFRAVGDKSKEATTLNNIGSVYSDLGEKQKALEYYNQALPLTRAVGDKSGEATTLNNIGKVYDALGEKQKALEYLNQALPLFRAVGDKSGEATTLNNIGSVYSDLGENQKALEYYNQALPLFRAVGDKSGEATTLNNIGKVYSDLGEKQKALEYYNQALPLFRAVGDKSGEATTLGNIAQVERNQGNLQQALTQIQAAINIIENLRTKIVSQELRTSYFASVQDYYQFYIDLLMRLHKKDPSNGYDAKALHISERSRARILTELLTEAHADIRNGVDPKLLAEEQRLQQLIDSTTTQLKALADTPEKKPAIQKVKNLLSQQEELKTKIRSTSPKYAALKYPEPLKLPQIQQQLDKDTLLLEYSLGKEHSYLWAVTPTSITSYELPKRVDIEATAKSFYQWLLNPSSKIDSSRGGINVQPTSGGTTAAVTKLSQMLLQPVAGLLGNKRLLIVSDGALQSISFAALNDPTSAKSKAKGQINYQPLIVNHEIVNLPSITTIATQRQELKGRKSAPKTLAILADPVFEANDPRVTGKPQSIAPDLDIRVQIQQADLKRAAKSFNRDGWNKLPYTRVEADAILKLVTATESLQAFDFDANYNWVTSKQLSQYRYIHFATHGFADPDNPELSGIVLSLVDKRGLPTLQGYLKLGNIFNLDFPADLVVLSACETGLGKNVQGEGLVGLTRGLMYAGAERVGVSLWSVNDKATAELMQEFYQEMLQLHKSPTTALRAAQLKLWQNPDLNNPYYWAAFTLQGEWR